MTFSLSQLSWLSCRLLSYDLRSHRDLSGIIWVLLFDLLLHLLPYCKFVVAGSQIRRRLDVAELSPTVALIVQ